MTVDPMYQAAAVALRCAGEALRDALFVQDETADPQTEFWRGYREGVESSVLVLTNEARKLEEGQI